MPNLYFTRDDFASIGKKISEFLENIDYSGILVGLVRVFGEAVLALQDLILAIKSKPADLEVSLLGKGIFLSNLTILKFFLYNYFLPSLFKNIFNNSFIKVSS